MNTTLKLPKTIEDALQGLNPSTSRRHFLASSGALVGAVSEGGRAMALREPLARRSK